MTIIRYKTNSVADILLGEPVDVEVQLEGRLIGRVMSVEVVSEKLSDVVDVVVVARAREHTLIGVMARIVLIPQRVYRDLPQTRVRLGGALEGSAQVGRVASSPVLLVVFDDRLLFTTHRLLQCLIFFTFALLTTIPNTRAENIFSFWALLLFCLFFVVGTVERLPMIPSEWPERRRTFGSDNARVVGEAKVVCHLEHSVST